MSAPIGTEVTSLGMTQIRKWEDVTLFAGNFVAYKANNYYFNKGSDGYTLEDAQIRYGYIPEKATTWSGNHKGYEIYRLVKTDIEHATCGLTTPKLESHSPFSMRLATPEEVCSINKKITANEAEFESVSGLEMKSVLNKTIKKIVKRQIFSSRL